MYYIFNIWLGSPPSSGFRRGKFVVSFFLAFFLGYTLKISYYIPFKVMSENLLSICDCPTICKTLKYIDQSDNSF